MISVTARSPCKIRNQVYANIYIVWVLDTIITKNVLRRIVRFLVKDVLKGISRERLLKPSVRRADVLEKFEHPDNDKEAFPILNFGSCS
jgi:hypothetical protein